MTTLPNHKERWKQASDRHADTIALIKREQKITNRDVLALAGMVRMMDEVFEEVLKMKDAEIKAVVDRANTLINTDRQTIRDLRGQVASIPMLQQQLTDAQNALTAQQNANADNTITADTQASLTTLLSTVDGVDVTVTPGATVGAGPVLKNVGGVVQTDAGQTLYTFSGATPDATFAPYYVPAAPTGVDGLGAVPVNDQLLATWNSSPLYTFPGEPSGQVTQDGANGGQWKAVRV